MNHWKETAEIVARLRDIEAAGRRAALATVVRIVGSAYRRPGAKLLIEEAGGTVGSVSGGCLEADVREIAAAVLASGRPWLRHYDTADENILWGLGLGCNGQVDVLVQPATSGPLHELLPQLSQLFAGDAPFALGTTLPDGEPEAVIASCPAPQDEAGQHGTGALGAPGGRSTGANESTWLAFRDGATLRIETGSAGSGGSADGSETVPENASAGSNDSSGFDGASDASSVQQWRVAGELRSALAAGSSGVRSVAGRRMFVEVQQPPPYLLVCGAGDDARPLVAYAADQGFRVVLLDHRPGLLDPAWFPQASDILTARPEDPAVPLPPGQRSLAVVKTHSLHHDRAWLRRLLGAGLPYIGMLGPRARTDALLHDVEPGHEDAADRVFGPVGLDLGADGPRQVAVSIVAELLAFVAHREPRHLSERREAIHVG